MVRAERRRGGDRRKPLWLIAVALVSIVVVSGGLIAYDVLYSKKCDVGAVGALSDISVRFDGRSSLLPNLSLIAVGPDTARYEVYLFYDLYCPYCAWEFYESLHILLGYARSGKVKIYFVDTILHSEARESHGLLRSSVDFNGSFIKALYLASCRLHVEGRVPDAGYMKSLLGELNITVPSDRVQAETAKAQQITREALRILLELQRSPYVGTPTIVVYDVESRRAEIIQGRVEPERIDLLLKSLP